MKKKVNIDWRFWGNKFFRTSAPKNLFFFIVPSWQKRFFGQNLSQAVSNGGANFNYHLILIVILDCLKELSILTFSVYKMEVQFWGCEIKAILL